MSVPAQVKKQSEAVQALYRDLEGGEADPENPGAAAQPEGDEPGQEQADGRQEPAVESTPSEPGEDNRDETWEQKYRTLQGMYNAEVPRLQAQLREASQRMHSMEQLLASMQSAQPNGQGQGQGQQPAAPSAQSLLTDQEREEYGDSIDVMRKVMQEEVHPYQAEIDRLNGVISELRGHVVPRVEQLSQQHAHSAEQNFWSQLSQLVPNWREVNDNPDFQTWLLEPDPLSGYTRQSFLDDAQAKLDANRVAGFFSSWQKMQGTSSAQSNRPDPQAELERQVTPGRSRNSGAPQGEQQQTYTPQDIQKFFEDVRKGAYRGKEEERDRIERDIFAAQRDGRIVQA